MCIRDSAKTTRRKASPPPHTRLQFEHINKMTIRQNELIKPCRDKEERKQKTKADAMGAQNIVYGDNRRNKEDQKTVHRKLETGCIQHGMKACLHIH